MGASRISVVIEQLDGGVTLLELNDIANDPSGFVNEFTGPNGEPMIAVSGHVMVPTPTELRPVVGITAFTGDDALSRALAQINPPATEETEQSVDGGD